MPNRLEVQARDATAAKLFQSIDRQFNHLVFDRFDTVIRDLDNLFHRAAPQKELGKKFELAYSSPRIGQLAC